MHVHVPVPAPECQHVCVRAPQCGPPHGPTPPPLAPQCPLQATECRGLTDLPCALNGGLQGPAVCFACQFHCGCTGYLLPRMCWRMLRPARHPACARPIAAHRYASQRHPGRFPAGRLGQVLQQGRNHKGRLLHYFPPQPQHQHQQQQQQQQQQPDGQPQQDQQHKPSRWPSLEEQNHCLEHKQQQQQQQQGQDQWCGWHTDHGSLTGGWPVAAAASGSRACCSCGTGLTQAPLKHTCCAPCGALQAALQAVRSDRVVDG